MTRATQQVAAIRAWIEQMEKEAKAARETGTLAGTSSAVVAETFIRELRARMEVDERPRTVREIIEDVMNDRAATTDVVTYVVREGLRMRKASRWTQEMHTAVSTGMVEMIQPYLTDVPETPAELTEGL